AACFRGIAGRVRATAACFRGIAGDGTAQRVERQAPIVSPISTNRRIADRRRDARTAERRARDRAASAASSRRLSVAPMMERTDRHCRYFLRLLAPRAWLYTEMVTSAALVHGDRARLLR